MEDVLDVYSLPFDPKHRVVCFDESPKQLVSEVRIPYIDAKGVKYEDCEYKREGSADIFMIVEPLGQRREVFVEDGHNGMIWAKKMAYIAEEMYANEPDSVDKITVVMDNLSTHKKYNLYNAFGPERARDIINKLQFVYTPKHGSWLNIAECELSVLSRQALDTRFPSMEILRLQVQTWSNNRNNKQKGVNWQFRTPDARIKLKRLYPEILLE
jgi:DDE superfamily endonuclease